MEVAGISHLGGGQLTVKAWMNTPSVARSRQDGSGKSKSRDVAVGPRQPCRANGGQAGSQSAMGWEREQVKRMAGVHPPREGLHTLALDSLSLVVTGK